MLSDKLVQATAAAGTGVTLTLPAPPTGYSHLITQILVSRCAAALLVAGSAPVVITTTNLPGSLTIPTPAEALAAGSVTEQPLYFEGAPLVAAAAATATTLIAPATTDVKWTLTVFYTEAQVLGR